MDEKELNQLSQQIGLDWELVGLPELSPVDKRAALLLLLIHKGFNNSFWGSKRLRYWDAFENNLLRATAAADLPEFVELFSGAMGATIGRNQAQRAIAMKLVYAPGGDGVLECILAQRIVMTALVQAIRDAIPSAYDYAEDEGEVAPVGVGPVYVTGDDKVLDSMMTMAQVVKSLFPQAEISIPSPEDENEDEA